MSFIYYHNALVLYFTRTGTTMHLSFCVDIDTNVRPHPYHWLDYVTLVVLVVTELWFASSCLVIYMQRNSARVAHVRKPHIMVLMNIGAALHCVANYLSNGAFVGVAFWDLVRNLHCTLWEFWIALAFGFNTWFCAVVYVAIATAIYSHRHSGIFADRKLIARAAVYFLTALIFVLCVVDEITGASQYDAVLDACYTKPYLKAVVIFYVLCCAVLTTVFAVVSYLYRGTDYTVYSSVRGLSVASLLILVGMIAANLTNITVYPLGRMLSTMMLCALYFYSNTLFHRDIIKDVIQANTASDIAVDFELEAIEVPSDCPELRDSARRNALCQALERSSRFLSIPTAVLATNTPSELIASISNWSVAISGPQSFVIDDEDDNNPSVPSDSMYFYIPLPKIGGLLTAIYNAELSQTSYELMLMTHFPLTPDRPASLSQVDLTVTHFDRARFTLPIPFSSVQKAYSHATQSQIDGSFLTILRTICNSQFYRLVQNSI